jgi:dTDP-glucose 4,6-dehydratase
VENHPNYRFLRGDIADPEAVRAAMEGCTHVVNFAAETHVDRSLLGDASFIETDVRGVFVLLEEARRRGIRRFIQISTDEVYGSIAEGSFREDAALNPRNPYAASKAGGDRLAYSYWASYGMPVVITRASNNYGPYQYPEKLIPLFVTNAVDGEPLPLYGDGRNVRDWLYVLDHAAAIDFLLETGEPGQTYNIAGGNETENIEITRRVLQALGKPESLIRFVDDRPGHDRRYSLDAGRLARLGFTPKTPFDQGLAETIAWYRAHQEWWRPIKEKDAAYRDFYRSQYERRLQTSSATAKEPG